MYFWLFGSHMVGAVLVITQYQKYVNKYDICILIHTCITCSSLQLNTYDDGQCKYWEIPLLHSLACWIRLQTAAMHITRKNWNHVFISFIPIFGEEAEIYTKNYIT